MVSKVVTGARGRGYTIHTLQIKAPFIYPSTQLPTNLCYTNQPVLPTNLYYQSTCAANQPVLPEHQFWHSSAAGGECDEGMLHHLDLEGVQQLFGARGKAQVTDLNVNGDGAEGWENILWMYACIR